MRDFIVNHHWTPRGVTLLWVGAVLFGSTSAAWYLMDHRGWAPRWLVELGQTAMMLYFVHQIIVFTVVKKWLGVAFHSWLGYWVANVVLMVLLLYIGKAWLWLTAAPPPEALAARRAGPLHGVIAAQPPPRRRDVPATSWHASRSH